MVELLGQSIYINKNNMRCSEQFCLSHFFQNGQVVFCSSHHAPISTYKNYTAIIMDISGDCHTPAFIGWVALAIILTDIFVFKISWSCWVCVYVHVCLCVCRYPKVWHAHLLLSKAGAVINSKTLEKFSRLQSYYMFRIQFIHWYKCSWSATKMYRFHVAFLSHVLINVQGLLTIIWCSMFCLPVCFQKI